LLSLSDIDNSLKTVSQGGHWPEVVIMTATMNATSAHARQVLQIRHRNDSNGSGAVFSLPN